MDGEIYEEIIGLISLCSDVKSGLNIREIEIQLEYFPPVDIKHAINELCLKGVLIENSESTPSRYIFAEHIEEIDFHNDLEQFVVKDSDLWVEDEVIRAKNSQQVLESIAKAGKSVMYSIAERYTTSEGFAGDVFKIATQIAEENPVDLLLEMLEWVVNDINELANTLISDVALNPKDVRKVARELGFRAKKAERLFQRLFRMDDRDILTIPSVKSMERSGATVKFNKVRARKRLEERIYGDRFINIVEVPENTHQCAVGTDASIGDITVSHARGSFIPPVPASLFIAGASMRVIRKGDSGDTGQYWDYDIEPRDFDSYAELQAAEEGLFISPSLREEVITDFQHLCVASMELRQYLEELRVINGGAKWHPMGSVPELDMPPKINLMFRDGRIFPLVHRIEDYEGASAPEDLLYGTIVKKEIDTFYNVFHNTVGRGRMGATYAGAVKAPNFSWLSMIVFWYLYKVTGEEIFKNKAYRPPLNDQAVSHLLFWGICYANPKLMNTQKRYTLITFQTIRRFSDIAFSIHPLIYKDENGKQHFVDESSSDDWYNYISYHVREVDRSHREHQRGVGSLGSVDEYDKFIELCHRASVAMFYGAPCRIYEATISHGAHALMPRWEVSLDISQDGFKNTLNRRLNDVLMWITDPDGLDEDGKHAVGGFAEVSSSLPLMIPDVVAVAHKAVTFTRSEQTQNVQDEIYKLINLIRVSS